MLLNHEASEDCQSMKTQSMLCVRLDTPVLVKKTYYVEVNRNYIE